MHIIVCCLPHRARTMVRNVQRDGHREREGRCVRRRALHEPMWQHRPLDLRQVPPHGHACRWACTYEVPPQACAGLVGWWGRHGVRVCMLHGLSHLPKQIYATTASTRARRLLTRRAIVARLTCGSAIGEGHSFLPKSGPTPATHLPATQQTPNPPCDNGPDIHGCSLAERGGVLLLHACPCTHAPHARSPPPGM